MTDTRSGGEKNERRKEEEEEDEEWDAAGKFGGENDGKETEVATSVQRLPSLRTCRQGSHQSPAPPPPPLLTACSCKLTDYQISLTYPLTAHCCDFHLALHSVTSARAMRQSFHMET
jgi:hypothetical protein